ncbi:MAG: hypothetical protein ABSB25_00575 [Sedimentisphaerales bacterium]|jgi:hypothetical protein
MTNGAISSILRMVILFAQLNVIFYSRFIVVFSIASPVPNYTGTKHNPPTYNLADIGGSVIIDLLLR